MEQCNHEIITSDNYVDIWERSTVDIDIEKRAEEVGAACMQNVFEEWVLFSIPMNPEDCEAFYLNSEYVLIPNVYGLASLSSVEAAGIGPVLKSKTLNLAGNGVIIAIIDTGIDYTHEAFIYEDNTSKILGIWDQTRLGSPPEGFYYGTEYTNEQINEALQSEDPLALVPEVDEVGHGTFLAGLAAGRPNRGEKFQGAAPNADLVIVKLKQAKKCLKNFFQIKEDAIAYQTSDIIQGLNYVLEKSKQFKKPIVILFALASNDGPHNGNNETERILANVGNVYGVVVVTAAGNEANTAHHYHGVFKEVEKKINAQMNIAENEKGVFLNMWTPLPDKLAMEIISPSGNTTGIIPFKKREWQFYNFPLETSSIRVWYDLVEERAAEESIAIMIKRPLPGLWTLVVHGDIIVNGEFDIYLPTRTFVNKNTVFLSPNPNQTIVMPATNTGTITVGAYNEVINSIYLPSSRGYTRGKRIKPDIVAPGANVIGPYPNNSYGTMSGSSIGAAIAVGASALLLEWGIVKKNDLTMNTTSVATYLARGARRRRNIKYPNREWGYGELDLFNTFKEIQQI